MNFKSFISSNKWKEKAKEGSKEKKALNKRIKELTISRDNYRSKFYTIKGDYQKAERARFLLEKEFTKKEQIKEEKPKHHSFSIKFIQVMLSVTLTGGLKFKSLERDNKLRTEITGEYERTPSDVTLRNWTLKLGYYELKREKERTNDWITLLDHSIQFGKEKIFVVLGIRKETFLKLERPLKYTDLTPLLIKSSKKWNGELVANEMTVLNKKYGIVYAVADYGSDLKKGLRLSGIAHFHDLSHLVSLLIEKQYKNDSRYSEFKAKMSLMRSKFIQTDIAAIVPPKRRKKSEYQSFDKIIKWARKVLNLVNNTLKDTKKVAKLKENFTQEILEKIQKELSWINDYQDLIEELTEINTVVKSIEKDIKHKGLSALTINKAKISLKKLKSKNGIEFKDKLTIKLEEQFNLLPAEKINLFSSDILESTFGKYKNRVSENLMASVTILMLLIAAFTVEITEDSVRKAMEYSKVSDLDIWKKQEVGVSLHWQRTALLAA